MMMVSDSTSNHEPLFFLFYELYSRTYLRHNGIPLSTLTADSGRHVDTAVVVLYSHILFL